MPPEPVVEFKPFIPASESPPEFTLAPVIVGSLLGILFGASSMYLVLKVGLTVSASIPVAVLSFAMFRGLSSVFGLRQRTILENNIVQTAGSAGESIAFGVGLAMPALLLLGFDIDVVRVMTVGVLGGLLGILMMVPLRRVFIVQKHGELKYPEGTACADVLIAGEKGGSTARLLFIGMAIGFVHTLASSALKLVKEGTNHALDKIGLKGGAVGGEWSAPLLGVGYIIGPRIASIMVAGGVLAYLVIGPLIVYFGSGLEHVLPPAKSQIDPVTGVEGNLIRTMSAKQIRSEYILYIGAGAVAAGGILSMLQALPVIVASVASAFRDLRKKGAAVDGTATAVPRTERDMPMSVVLLGCLGLVLALAAAPSLGLGLNAAGVAGAILILLFGFLFVTVSSRLTGEIGSSSNPISGMTVATLLLTCLALLALSQFGVLGMGKETKLLALTIAGVVCIACSNGGTTAQALKTGHLVGATPIAQQYAILIGSLTSALVVGLVLIGMNQAGTIYSTKKLPTVTMDVAHLTTTDHVRSGPYTSDATEYAVLNLGTNDKAPSAWVLSGDAGTVPPGRYLIKADGTFAYVCDPAVNGKLTEDDTGNPVKRFDAPKSVLLSFIIDGIFKGDLPWDLILIGVLIALTLELSGVPALPFAVGVYLPLASSVPIFLGGLIRWLADKMRGPAAADGDSSPGVLLSSGYIAGGSIMAVIYAFMNFYEPLTEALDQTKAIGAWAESNGPALIAFGLMAMVLLVIGGDVFGKKRTPN